MAAVEIHNWRAVARSLVNDARQMARQAVDLGSRRSKLRRRDATAFAANLPLELLLPLDCERVLLPSRDQLLDEGTHVLELGVRLLPREVAHSAKPMPRLRAGRSLPAPSTCQPHPPPLLDTRPPPHRSGP